MHTEIVGRIRPTITNWDNNFMSGPFTPNFVEYTATELEVIGEVPRRLNGVYLRNTQNPVHEPRACTTPSMVMACFTC